jgi:hypothetical protein
MMSLAAQPPQETAFEMLGIEAIGLRPSVLSWHGDTRRVDDICLDVPCSQPSCQPEPISAGLESKSNTVDYSPRLDRLLLSPVHQCQQRIFVRWKLLEGMALDPRHDPGHEPARLTEFDYGYHCAILFKGGEGFAQVVYGRHRAILRRLLSKRRRCHTLAAYPA